MKKLIAIILVLISLSSYGQTPPRTGYLVQTAKWKFVNPIWLDSGAYITKIPKYVGQNRYLVYDSITGKIGYRYVSASGNFVPYTGATTDVDLGNFSLNAKSFHAKGTAGTGHLGLKHQSSSATASGSETVIYANSTGFLYSKNDGNAIEKIIGSNDTASMLSPYALSSEVPTYLAGNGILKGGVTFYRDSLKSTGQYGNAWGNGMMIKSTNNRSMLFGTNNLLAMTLDSNQRLGIGTRTPITLAQFKNNNSPFISITDSRTVDSLSTLRIGNVSDGSTYSYSGIWSGRSGLNYGSQMKLLFVPLTTILNVENSGSIQFRVNNNGVGLINTTSMTANTFRQDANGANYLTGNLTLGASLSISKLAIPIAPTATANSGLFSMSNTTTAFDGTTTGKFVGTATGQYIAVNSVGSVAYNFLDFQKNGTTLFEVDSTGKNSFATTITAAGTTGNRTINKPSGTVNIAAAGTTVTVTNSLVSTSSIVVAVIRTNDTTAYIKNVVPSSGSFVINLGAAATAEVSIGFIVYN